MASTLPELSMEATSTLKASQVSDRGYCIKVQNSRTEPDLGSFDHRILTIPIAARASLESKKAGITRQAIQSVFEN